MADVIAIFSILLTLGIAFPGMLTTWWLLFPQAVERARLRLERTPWQCAWTGVLIAFLLAIPITVLIALPLAPAKFAGWSLLALALAVSGVGAAGIAAQMGAKRSELGFQTSPASAFVRCAIALELAAVFPIIGWFIVIPFSILVALGATTFALLRWSPRINLATQPVPESLGSPSNP